MTAAIESSDPFIRVSLEPTRSRGLGLGSRLLRIGAMKNLMDVTRRSALHDSVTDQVAPLLIGLRGAVNHVGQATTAPTPG